MPLFLDDDLQLQDSNCTLLILQESCNSAGGVGKGTSDATVEGAAAANNSDMSNMIACRIEIASLERNRIEIVKTTMIETIKLEVSKTIECNFWKSYREYFCKPGDDSLNGNDRNRKMVVEILIAV